MLNLDELFRANAESRPRHPAIHDARRGWTTYSELDVAIESAAVALRLEGVQPGQCVGVHFPNGMEHIAWNYAVWRAGACVVPIPMELATDEKREILRKIAVDFVISHDNLPPGEFVASFQKEGSRSLPLNATMTSLNVAREHPVGFRDINAAFIRFSSGTTGASKGVVLSHESVRDRIQAANEAFQLVPSDRIVWVLSMSYHFTVSIVAYLSYGASIVLPANHWAGAILDSLRQQSGTLLYASPMHYAMLSQASDAAPIPSLRLAISTAMSLNTNVATEFRAAYGIPLSQALGIIEVGLPAVNVNDAASHPDSVGRVLSNYELCLQEAGLGPGLGEVNLRGKGMLDAYYDPWQPRGEIMPEGWFRTGDIGELDADGCLFIRGRTKDVINVAGMKVFPLEVEKVLESHAAVETVCVFATPDARCGEAVCARVVLRSPTNSIDIAGLLRHCRDRLASHKVPREIEIVTSLDRTASGKIRHPQRPVTTPESASMNQQECHA